MRADHCLKLLFLLMMIHTVFAYYQKLIKSAFEDTEKKPWGNLQSNKHKLLHTEGKAIFNVSFFLSFFKNPLLEFSIRVNFVAIVPGTNFALVISGIITSLFIYLKRGIKTCIRAFASRGLRIVQLLRFSLSILLKVCSDLQTAGSAILAFRALCFERERFQKPGRRAFGDLGAGSIILVVIYGGLMASFKGSRSRQNSDDVIAKTSNWVVSWWPHGVSKLPWQQAGFVLPQQRLGDAGRCCKSFAKKWPFRATDFFFRSVQRGRFTFRISIVYIGSGGWDFEIAMQSGAWDLVSPRISAVSLEPTGHPPKQAKLCGRSLRRGVRCCPRSIPRKSFLKF